MSEHDLDLPKKWIQELCFSRLIARSWRKNWMPFSDTDQKLPKCNTDVVSISTCHFFVSFSKYFLSGKSLIFFKTWCHKGHNNLQVFDSKVRKKLWKFVYNVTRKSKFPTIWRTFSLKMVSITNPYSLNQWPKLHMTRITPSRVLVFREFFAAHFLFYDLQRVFWCDWLCAVFQALNYNRFCLLAKSQ